MKKKKQFNAPDLIRISIAPEARLADAAASLVIELPENPSGHRRIDLSHWLGRGIDAWVWACTDQLRSMLAGGEMSCATVHAHATQGLEFLFQFLVVSTGPAQPQELGPSHTRLYVSWLKKQDWSYSTQRARYSHGKSVLVDLVKKRIVLDHATLFPVNPFPDSHNRMNSPTALSQAERLRFAHALREDLIAIHHKRFAGSESAALVVHLLAVAFRTGANLTPFLEARRDCLRQHPFMPNLMLLELFKRRGNATKLVNLRYSNEQDQSRAIPMDGVALIRKVQQNTQPLVAGAKAEHRDRLWLYKDGRPNYVSRVAVLTRATLSLGITALVARHSLRGDDGEPLRLNLSRLRKTVEQRLWALSGGDLIATAALMGHDPKIADRHYLACTQQIRENAAFVGEALAAIYSKGSSDGDGRAIIPILPAGSPTGRCKDPYNGDKAPKNGEPCDDFLSCFACTSYTIVGSPADLHRLFSFYWYLEREAVRARSADWRAEFRNTMDLIDRFTADKFEAGMVATAKTRAKSEPLQFWADYTLHNREVKYD